MSQIPGLKSSLGLTAVAVASIAMTAGCSSTDNNANSGGSITVFAAASLQQTFTDIGKQVEAANPGSKIAFDFGGSSGLVEQLVQGAPADVFASADATNMKKATDGGLVSGSPENFASNTLAIVVAPGNPKGIKTFADLNKPGELVVVCAPQVPCGSATKKVETATHIELHPVSEESSVTDVLDKVITGQADAGLVYVTDAAGAGDKVATVAFPESAGAVNTYPIAVLKDAKNPALAQKFVDFVDGPKGQAVLAKAGFHTP